MPKKLIVNADDFGRAPGITLGIIAAHEGDIVTTTTAMMNSPGVAEALVTTHQRCPQLGLGVHLVLTEGRPILPLEQVVTLVQDDGAFHPPNTFVSSAAKMAPSEVRRELRAQIGRFLATGLPLDHLDCHHQFAILYPPFFEIMLDLAAEYGVPIRPPRPASCLLKQMRGINSLLPSSTFRTAMLLFLRFGLGHPIQGLQRVNLSRKLWHTAMTLAQDRRVSCPDHFIDTFYGAGATLKRLLGIIDALPEGVSEIMCHPRYVDEALAGRSDYTSQRETEIAILTHPDVRARLGERGIQLITFAQIAE